MANPPNTGRPVDYAAQVRKAWGRQWKQPEVVYQFSGGKKVVSTDHKETGIYRTST